MIEKGARILFVLYIMSLCWILFIQPSATYSRIAQRSQQQQHNLVPFKTIKRYISTYHDYYFYHGMQSWLMNVGGNIVLYIPFGLLLPISSAYFRKKIGLVPLVGALWIIFSEVAQSVFRIGIMDIDDFILNFGGLLVGVLLFLASKRLIIKILQ